MVSHGTHILNVSVSERDTLQNVYAGMWQPIPISVWDRDTRSNIYVRMWKPIPISVSNRKTRSIKQRKITITMNIHTIIQ